MECMYIKEAGDLVISIELVFFFVQTGKEQDPIPFWWM